jgi:DNA-binding HxlR family transcriptional regulator
MFFFVCANLKIAEMLCLLHTFLYVKEREAFWVLLCIMKDFKFQGRVYYNPMELANSYIGGTWKMPVLLALRHGAVRYTVLKQSVKHISDKMLYSVLRDLEKKGMISRKVYSEKPPRVEYKLTPLGKKSMKVIDTLQRFGIHLMKINGL